MASPVKAVSRVSGKVKHSFFSTWQGDWSKDLKCCCFLAWRSLPQNFLLSVCYFLASQYLSSIFIYGQQFHVECGKKARTPSPCWNGKDKMLNIPSSFPWQLKYNHVSWPPSGCFLRSNINHVKSRGNHPLRWDVTKHGVSTLTTGTESATLRWDHGSV